MNISETVKEIIIIEKAAVLIDTASHRAKIAAVLQEFLDSGGVGREYMETKR